MAGVRVRYRTAHEDSARWDGFVFRLGDIQDCEPQQRPDSLSGVMRHIGDAWSRRAKPNVVLVHYNDLIADLEGEMRRLAARLGITVPAPALVTPDELAWYHSRAAEIAPPEMLSWLHHGSNTA